MITNREACYEEATHAIVSVTQPADLNDWFKSIFYKPTEDSNSDAQGSCWFGDEDIANTIADHLMKGKVFADFTTEELLKTKDLESRARKRLVTTVAGHMGRIRSKNGDMENHGPLKDFTYRGELQSQIDSVEPDQPLSLTMPDPAKALYVAFFLRADAMSLVGQSKGERWDFLGPIFADWSTNTVLQMRISETVKEAVDKAGLIVVQEWGTIVRLASYLEGRMQNPFQVPYNDVHAIISPDRYPDAVSPA